jgi:hypothetical protein
VPLDEDAVRLAQGKNLATVVTLMPSGQPQGRVILKIAADKVNTPKTMGRR